METIQQLLKNGNKIYPVTSTDAVIDPSGKTVTNRLNYILNNYQKSSDLVSDLNLAFGSDLKSIVLLLGNVELSRINTDNFAINGVISSAAYDDGNLVLEFTSGETVNIPLDEVLSSVFSEFTAAINEIKSMHVVLTEEEYNNLPSIDPDKFYYTYEDE